MTVYDLGYKYRRIQEVPTCFVDVFRRRLIKNNLKSMVVWLIYKRDFVVVLIFFQKAKGIFIVLYPWI